MAIVEFLQQNNQNFACKNVKYSNDFVCNRSIMLKIRLISKFRNIKTDNMR